MSTLKPKSASSPALATKALYVSHFTPSMMLPETLEAMLVQREPLLQRSLGNVLESLRAGSSHHTLFVGPRGIGKTHLISLLHHRLSQAAGVQGSSLVAWMREEEWGVTSFFELVLRILRTLDASYPELEIEGRTRPVYELPLKEAEKLAESILLEVLGSKRLVLLLENLDDLFDQLGDQGQKAWRAFIQNHNNMVLVCTTPSLFAGVSLHKSAFYGFFDIEPLTELDFEDVVSLLNKIAVERGDQELAAFIATSEGRARIRAVHHLAEGNPRIYIIFAQFLSAQALDELVPAFMHTLDELTPYYQARMKELSGQQRKIVEYLVSYRGAAPVKQIAKSCFITQQTCSSQLKQLKEKRYVRSIEQGRESFYELCEPLMRLCMEVKKQRGEPIGLFVEMLQIWYSQEELQNWLKEPERLGPFDARYIWKALENLQKQRIEPKLQAQLKELQTSAKAKDLKQVNAVLDEIAGTKSTNSVSAHVRALILLSSNRSPELREKIRPELEKLAVAFESLLNVWIAKLTRANSKMIYATLTKASFGLFALDETIGRKSLPEIATLLIKFPAQAQVALFQCNGLANSEAFIKWTAALFEQLSKAATTNRLLKFLKVAKRMSEAFSKWSETKDTKYFLELPIEERQLLLSFAEKTPAKA
ncbi:MAG: AAA family ATPase [Rhodoferax sp.]|nr:AAA family ATPase [Rhodoferax sp.]